LYSLRATTVYEHSQKGNRRVIISDQFFIYERRYKYVRTNYRARGHETYYESERAFKGWAYLQHGARWCGCLLWFVAGGCSRAGKQCVQGSGWRHAADSVARPFHTKNICVCFETWLSVGSGWRVARGVQVGAAGNDADKTRTSNNRIACARTSRSAATFERRSVSTSSVNDAGSRFVS